MGDDLRKHFCTLVDEMRNNPLDDLPRLVLADWLDEHGNEGDRWAVKELRAGRVPLIKFDRDAAIALGDCRFAPGTWDKKFAATVSSAAFNRHSLTPKQWLWMWILIRRYRKSFGNAEILAEAERRYNGCVDLLGVAHLKKILDRNESGGVLLLWDDEASFHVGLDAFTEEPE